jgi:glycosyltransferase domain-containing protein
MNQQPPLVSVIIPTYNRPNYVKRAVESILNQTYKNIEIVIVDGSTNDVTEKAIQPYSIHHQIHYIRQNEIHNGSLEQNISNASRARNEGVKAAKGKYIATLDDDDFWCNERKLEKQVKFLEENQDYIACGGGTIIFQEKNPKKAFIFARLPQEKDEDIRKKMFLEGISILSGLCFRKSAWEAVGGYDENPHLNEDYDFCFKLGKVGKVYNFPEYFVYFSIGEQNKAHWKTARRRIRYRIQLIKKYQKDYPGYSKAILLNWLDYFYTFLPFHEKLRPFAAKIKRIILSPIINKI